MRGAVKPGTEPGLEATRYFGPYRGATASGCHACILEVDPETMQVEVKKYVVVHDCGRVINPLLVDGQVHGGVAQGIGNAFYEQLVYDDNGQLLNASFMDFLLPTALDVPRVDVGHEETRSPLNPLGTKGAGEAGAIPVGALFAQALEDALSIPGLEILEIPLETEPALGADPGSPVSGGPMKIQGEHTFDAPRERVWQALLDPGVLARTLPGCERLERTAENEYRGVLNVQVGPVKGQFQGTLHLSDLVPQESYHMKLDGSGPAGFMNGQGGLRLADAPAGGTVLRYDLDAQVGGKLAGLGQRLVESSARSITKLGLEGLGRELQALDAPAEAAPTAPAPLTPKAPPAPTQAELAARVAGDVMRDLVPPSARKWVIGGGLLLLVTGLWRKISRRKRRR